MLNTLQDFENVEASGSVASEDLKKTMNKDTEYLHVVVVSEEDHCSSAKIQGVLDMN